LPIGLSCFGHHRVITEKILLLSRRDWLPIGSPVIAVTGAESQCLPVGNCGGG
jgi:hypothetical protein